MLTGMLTKSKTEILLKNGATLDRVHTSISTIDGVVDTDKIDKAEVLTDASVLKIEEITEVDVDKIVEQT